MDFCFVSYSLKLHELPRRSVAGGYYSNRPQLRLELKQFLIASGYDLVREFPEDGDLGVPLGVPWFSDYEDRLNLILDTQTSLYWGEKKRDRGLSCIDSRPAWELKKILTSGIPHGELETTGWPRRWIEAGGPPVVHSEDSGAPRFIALKTDPVWARLGDSRLFSAALDVDYPPFAFGSGMGWLELSRDDYTELTGIELPPVPPCPLPGGLTRETNERLQAIATPEYRAALRRRLKGNDKV